MLRSNIRFVVDSGHGGRTRDQKGDEADGWDDGNAVHPRIPTLRLKKKWKLSFQLIIRQLESLLTM
jgi:hypothetical protein